ncbi:zinc-dependent metalloprotease [Cellulomonas persica]|nr:zinc-dependent metalloprotease [Cellulomonas persica]
MNATTGPVDWDTARRVAARAARPGPTASRAELEDLVGALREAAGPAAEHAARVTRLTPADGREPAEVSRVLVVDRAGWTRANVQMFATMSAPPAGADAHGQPDADADAGDATPARTSPAGRLAAGAQLGAALALLAGKVLGQFDPFTPPAGAGPDAPGEGRLLLVAPNVLHLERQLTLEPADFRLWVSLHEQTHALQFAAAPWLSTHLRTRFTQLLGELTGQGEETFGRMVSTVGKVLTDDESSILDVLTTEQRGLVDEVGAVMALLEGHADVAMDAVGRSVVPSVREIRRKFEDRRDKGARARGPAGVVRRLLGMDAKLAQYREGAVFVRAVRSRVGVNGLNAVWAASENLPSAAEIADPSAWVRRVHG